MNPKELHNYLTHLYHISLHDAKDRNLLENYTKTVQYLARIQYILSKKLDELEEQHNL